VLLLASAVRRSGAVDEHVEVESICRLADVMVLAFFIFMVATEGVGLVASRRVDRAQFPLPLGVCRWEASIYDRGSSGCVPG
jgi:hypothetical protein